MPPPRTNRLYFFALVASSVSDFNSEKNLEPPVHLYPNLEITVFGFFEQCDWIFLLTILINTYVLICYFANTSPVFKKKIFSQLYLDFCRALWQNILLQYLTLLEWLILSYYSQQKKCFLFILSGDDRF